MDFVIEKFMKDYDMSYDLAYDIVMNVLFGEPVHSDFASEIRDRIFPRD